MGFSKKKCMKALKNNDNSMVRATDQLLNHMEDPEDEESDSLDYQIEEGDDYMQDVNDVYKCDKPGIYKL